MGIMTNMDITVPTATEVLQFSSKSFIDKTFSSVVNDDTDKTKQLNHRHKTNRQIQTCHCCYCRSGDCGSCSSCCHSKSCSDDDTRCCQIGNRCCCTHRLQDISYQTNILSTVSTDITLVVTVPVVGGVVDVVVVLDMAGFQISNLQNASLRISADSASIHKNIFIV